MENVLPTQRLFVVIDANSRRSRGRVGAKAETPGSSERVIKMQTFNDREGYASGSGNRPNGESE